jgi:pyruvate kinase
MLPDPEIVATLGPSSRGLAASLRDAGATSIRLNASHLSVEDLGTAAAEVRQADSGLPVVIDLQGAKMRLGGLDDRAVEADDRIVFSLSGSGGTIPLPHPELFAAVAVGDTLSSDDGRLRFRVEGVCADSLRAVSLTRGTLRSRKGINVVEHPIALQNISPRDLACIRATACQGGVSFAFSFMRDGTEASWIRRHAPDCAVIGKVERGEAVRNVRAMASLVDALWICRGDLGAQLGPAALARWISAYEPRAERCPVLMAGQVMEHLTLHGEPTRTEVCHLWDLVARGYAGFVLSDETAIGRDPVYAVRKTRSLLAAFSGEVTV